MTENPFNTSAREFLDMFLLDLQQAIMAPAANPALAVLSLLIVLVLIAFVFVVGVSLWALFTGQYKRVARVRVPPTRADRWINRVVALIFLATLAIPFTHYTEAERNCLNCHAEGEERRTLDESVHAELTCIDCHMRPGVSGYAEQKADFSRWVSRYIVYGSVPENERLVAEMSGASCLACHGGLLDAPITSGFIRVNHAEIIQGDVRCMDCHNQVAHAGLVLPERTPSMSTCMRCHDGERARSECAVCHTADIGEGSQPRERTFPRPRTVEVAWNYCYGCHNEDRECMPCHGVTMPHPPDWVGPGPPTHAPAAAFTRKQVCWRCHYSPEGPGTVGRDFCQQCHAIMVHGPDRYTYWSHRRYSVANCTGLCHTTSTCTAVCHPWREPVELPPPMRDYPFVVPDFRDFPFME